MRFFIIYTLIALFLSAAASKSVTISSPGTNKNLLTSNKKSKTEPCPSRSLIQSKILAIQGGSSDDALSVDWRYFAAGGICAAVSHGITTPLDVIKTKMQTSPEKYNKGMLHAAKDIISTEGAGFLLAGLGNWYPYFIYRY